MKHASREKTHVIRGTKLWALLLLGSVLAFWNWVIVRHPQGRPVRLPSFLRQPHPYTPKIIEYDEQKIQTLNQTRTEWSSGCPEDCGAFRGWGICDEARCICYEGHGGSDCGINLEVFYGDHDVYWNLTLQPLDVSGWDLGGDLYRLLVERINPNLVVEIGVWKGASATKLAMALKEQGAGVLLAVDTWLPMIDFGRRRHKDDDSLEDLHFERTYAQVFDTFLGNVIQLNLTDFVIPLPATSRSASEVLSNRHQMAELIHIDAGHSYVDIEEDIRIWWRVLRPGGILLGDDWSITWPGVLKAVREHGSRYHLDIHVYRNKWWMYKPLEKQ